MATIDPARTAPAGAASTATAATIVTRLAASVKARIDERVAARALADDLMRLPRRRLADIGMTEADVVAYRARSGLL